MNKNIVIFLCILGIFAVAFSCSSFIPWGNGYHTLSGSKAPMLSGPVTEVPWEDDEKFLKAQEEINASVLLAAYKTVLFDPLPGEEYNVHLAAEILSGTVVKSGEIFSQNQTIGPYDTSKGFQRGPTYVGTKLTTTIGGGVCKISSTLYNVAVLSNIKIVERYAHSMPVPYVPYGQDATVSYGIRDFRFINNTSYPILIWALGVDNTLYIGFYGREKPPKIEWHHEILSVKKADTIYKKDPSLKIGEQRMGLEGMDGACIKSWITIEKPDGEVARRDLGISRYMPMPHIILVGE